MKRLALVLLLALLAVVAITALPRAALAAPRAEAAAKDALKKAEDDYLQMDFAKAQKRLQSADRGCGDGTCTNATRAALVRDIGVMQLRLGDHDAALASFKRAKKIDPTIALNPSYESKDLHEAWEGTIAGPAPAGGDFTHTPPSGGVTRTPLAIYVVATTSEALASVAVKYKNDDMKGFRRVALKKVGDGWGGYIPCADMVPGTIRYFVQGFDKEGALVANAGDPSSTFSVTIKDSGDVASLPGAKPPRQCGDEELETLNLLEGDRCQEDRQCKSGSCSDGRCKGGTPASAEEDQPAPGSGRAFARFWVGVVGALDLSVTPAKNDVCKLNGPFWCTTPEGNDYPGNDAESAALIAGRAGQAGSGVNAGNFHVEATLDYAVNANLLVGARLGYVAGAYPGKAAQAAGKTIGPPVHAELRGTYLFGEEPLARAGLAPYVFGALGVARFDASTTVLVGEKNVVGDRAVQAWVVAGPVFAATGVGARYAFSRRAAVSTGLVLDAAIAPGAFAFILAPEIQLQYGF